MHANRQTLLLIGLIVIAAIVLRLGGGTSVSAPQPTATAISLAQRLSEVDRTARLVVLGRKSDRHGAVVNDCLFAELAPDGSRWIEVRRFDLKGNTLTIDARVLPRGNNQSVMLFVSAQGPGERPIALETPGKSPDFYSSGLVAVEAKEAPFWNEVWAERGKNILTAQVKLFLSPAARFELRLNPDGKMRARQFLMNAQDAAMLHKSVVLW